jgi:cysteine-rich repeat protein
MRGSLASHALVLALFTVGCGSSGEFPIEFNDAAAGDTASSADTSTNPETSVTDSTPPPGDTMTTSDTAPSSCGNSVVDYAMGEECDDGNIAIGDGCNACKREVGGACGNGALEPSNGEQCDDGNKTAGDGCSPTCQFEPVGTSCGNGTIEAPLEVCDDSNTNNGDGCNPTCNLKNTVSTWLTGVGATPALAADNTYLWMTDGNTFRVRRFDIATKAGSNIAGTGTSGYLDNAIGSAAMFGSISSITTDGATVWVADSRRIRAISATAPYAVTTIAGSGATGSADGTGTAATFNDPRGLTYYKGKLYLVDAAAPSLREIDPVSKVVKTIAGNPTALPGSTVDGCGASARFVSPRYIASDNSGMLYISDTNGAVVRAYNTVTGCVSTFAGTGTAGYVDGVGTAAQIHRPRGMTSDGTSIYWVEFNQHTLRQAVLATASVTTNAGQHCSGASSCTGGNVDGVGTAARFNGPWGITYHWPSRSLFISDTANSSIRRVQ